MINILIVTDDELEKLETLKELEMIDFEWYTANNYAVQFTDSWYMTYESPNKDLGKFLNTIIEKQWIKKNS